MAIPLNSVDANSAENAISELVRDRTSPELEAVYLKLSNVLFDAGVTYHLDELDLLWGQLNDMNIDPTDIVPSVDEILRIAVERALNNCGVEFSPEISLDRLAEASDIILNFDPTDTPTVLLDILNGAEDSDETLAKLLAQLGTYEEDDWYPDILNVSDNFVTAITKVIKHEVENSEAAENAPVASDDLLKRLSRLVRANKESLGATLGSSNIGLGVSMESLYGCHVETLLDLAVEQQVDELFSLAAISNESFESACTAISTSLDDLCTDVDLRRKAERERIRLTEVYRPIFGERHA